LEGKADQSTAGEFHLADRVTNTLMLPYVMRYMAAIIKVTE